MMEKVIYKLTEKSRSGWTVPERSCFTCKHCTDVLYDFTNGPYAAFSETYACNNDLGYRGECEDWEWDGVNRPRPTDPGWTKVEKYDD